MFGYWYLDTSIRILITAEWAESAGAEESLPGGGWCLAAGGGTAEGEESAGAEESLPGRGRCLAAGGGTAEWAESASAE